ncbi:MAG: hypothetical protein IVW55_08450, partial [Chloroflexi bacterium]|nr:hypothetical protein [Chloroflexota bacterium]
MSKIRSRRTLLLALLLLLLAAGAGAGALRWQGSTTVQKAQKAPAVALNEPDEAYSVNPGQASQGDGPELQALEDYWNTRVTYPTGKFDGSWLLNAAAKDKTIQSAVPAGIVTYDKANSKSPLVLDPNSWTSLGPQPLQSNGCQGCYSYGHVSGRINDIVIDPVTSNVAYIASVGGGIWKTTNCCTATTSWTPVLDDPAVSTVSIDSVTIDPSNHNIVYAGTGDLNYGSFSMGSTGVLKSTDAGATWVTKGADVFGPYYPGPAGTYPQYQAIGKVRVDPLNSNNIIAGTKTGVYFSYNGGDNWSGPCAPDAYPTQRQDITGLIVRGNGSLTDLFVVVGTRGFSTTVQPNLAENGANGIYKTSMPASGCPANWTLLTTPTNGWPAGTGSGIPVYQTGGNTLGRIDVAMAPGNPNYIYAQVQAIQTVNGQQRGGQLGLWRTTDGGTTWQKRSDQNALAGCGMDYAQNWYDQGLAVDPNNPDALFMDTFDIWKSTDGGTTLNDVTCGYNGGNTVHVDQHALFYVPGSSSSMLAGSDGGAYVTNNANAGTPTFSQLNDTLNTIEFYSGDITANFANSTAQGANGGAQDNGSSVVTYNTGDPGPALWQLKVGGDGFYARIDPVTGTTTGGRWYQENNSSHVKMSTTGPNGNYIDISGGWLSDPRSFTSPYEIYKNDCPATGCTHMIFGSNRVWETITGGVGGGSTWHSNS